MVAVESTVVDAVISNAVMIFSELFLVIILLSVRKLNTSKNFQIRHSGAGQNPVDAQFSQYNKHSECSSLPRFWPALE